MKQRDRSAILAGFLIIIPHLRKTGTTDHNHLIAHLFILM
jgi:hypothetical protein